MGCIFVWRIRQRDLTSPLYANVGFWFRQQPGLALGITAGGAVGQGVMPLCAGLAISAYVGSLLI